MQLRAAAAVAVLLLATGPGQAGAEPFEGVLHIKSTAAGRVMDFTLSVGRSGMRTEVSTPTPNGPMPLLTYLVDYERPTVVTQLDARNRAYREVPLPGPGEREAADAALTVTPRGAETLHGLECRHVVATDALGSEYEVWTTRDLLEYERLAESMEGFSSSARGLTAALREADADGFVVKLVYRRNGQLLSTLELERAEAKALDPMVFRVPAGYRKVDAPAMAPSRTPAPAPAKPPAPPAQPSPAAPGAN